MRDTWGKGRFINGCVTFRSEAVVAPPPSKPVVSPRKLAFEPQLSFPPTITEIAIAELFSQTVLESVVE